MTDLKNNKAMNIGLWVAQALLAAMFIMAGGTKLAQPITTLAESMPWINNAPAALIRFIGASELAGGLGLLLPSILRIKPKLTVYAALGLVTIMILAAAFHASRGEFGAIGANLAFAAIAAFVAWGRSKKAPILAKA